MKQMVKKVHYKISQDLFIRDKKHHESGAFYLFKSTLNTIHESLNLIYWKVI